jgi:hypothetical protein
MGVREEQVPSRLRGKHQPQGIRTEVVTTCFFELFPALNDQPDLPIKRQERVKGK